MASPYTFISYARTDGEFVLRLAAELRAKGVSLWLDQLDINVGQVWDMAVENALESCDTFLVVLSPAAISSRNVMDELMFALGEDKKIVPLLYQECKIPFRIARLQFANFTISHEVGMNLLLKVLPIELKYDQEPGAPPVADMLEAKEIPEEKLRSTAGESEVQEQDMSLPEKKPQVEITVDQNLPDAGQDLPSRESSTPSSEEPETIVIPDLSVKSSVPDSVQIADGGEKVIPPSPPNPFFGFITKHPVVAATVTVVSLIIIVIALKWIPSETADNIVSSTVSPTPWIGANTPTPLPQGRGAKNYLESLQEGVKLEMVAILGGSFDMGGGYANEKPIHRVTLKPFYMGRFEVTQAQWKAVMGGNPSHFKGDDLPVEKVSWNDAQEFCKKLSQMTGKEYRLPSEAEWEYAARAGSTGNYCFGNDESLLKHYAWYDENSGKKTHPVGQKKPNDWGLYDMHGNVFEWCEDVWHENYNGAPTDGSAWVTDGNQERRGLRGGSWYFVGGLCRSAFRYDYEPGFRLNSNGFRVVVSART